MSKERQLRKQEETKEIILNTARDIIAEDGFQSLSIRKITKKIDYSPGIVYHYFKDKNEIIEILVSEGYKKIIASASNFKRDEDNPEKEIKEVFVNYIKSALESPDIYLAFMLNDESSIIKKTRLLKRGITEESKTIQILSEKIERGINKGKFKAWNIELTAQIIWTSIFGLLIKIIIEKDVSEKQIEELIQHNFEIIFKGIMN
ncbi:MAG: TetR/AcrR family transcriptional regulator [Eubacteriaceae bacterium]